MCYPCGVHVIPMWCACDTHVVYMRYPLHYLINDMTPLIPSLAGSHQDMGPKTSTQMNGNKSSEGNPGALRKSDSEHSHNRKQMNG